jgi:tetratricopeptide (TPR) repeat protein
LAFCFIALTQNSPAQSAPDSLYKALNEKNNDTLKIHAMLNIVLFYGSEAVDTIGKYSVLALDLLKGLPKDMQRIRNVQIAKTMALNNYAFYFDSRNNSLKAMELYKESFAIQEKMSDKKGMSSSYNNMGTIYHNQGNIAKALDCFVRSLHLEESLPGKTGNGTAECLNNIGMVYESQGDLQTALSYYLKSLKKEEQAGNKAGMGSSLNNIAAIYYSLGQYEKAIEYGNKSLELARSSGDLIGIAVALNSQSSFSLRLKDRKKAEEYLVEAKTILEKTDYKAGLSTILQNLGRMKMEDGKLGEAKRLLEKSYQIAGEIGNAHQLKSVAHTLSTFYEKTGDNTQALSMYRLFISMRDSLNNESTKKASIKQQLKYEYEKQSAADSVAHAKESEVKNAELSKQAAEIKAKKNQQYALFGGFALVLIFSIFLFNRYKITQKQKLVIEKQKQIVEEQKQLVEEKQKEVLDSIRYAERIQKAQLPSENYISKAFRKFNS